MLRDEIPEQFVKAVRDILFSPGVRFHLQHLTMQLLGHLENPKAEEVKCVTELLQDADMRRSAVSEILSRRTHWFRTLDAAGHWEACLRATEDWKVDMACWVLATVSGQEGRRVADLLSPYQDSPDPWPRRITHVLPWHAHEDPPNLFSLRLKLLQTELSIKPELWLTAELARQKPVAFIDLLVAICERSINRRNRTADSQAIRESSGFWIPRHLENVVREAVKAEPEYFWRKLFPVVRSVIQRYPAAIYAPETESFDGDSVWQDDLYRHTHCGAIPLPVFVASAAAQWMHADSATVIMELAALASSTSHTMQQIMGSAYLRGPDSVADEAIEWLLADARRLSLGNLGQERGWRLAGDIILRHAGLCSVERYGVLERTLLSYYPDEERVAYRHDLAGYRERSLNYRANDYGRLQHALLPTLPSQRRSPQTTNAIGQLNAKYQRTAEEMESERDRHGGAVRSPIAHRSDRLSDKAWLKLMRWKPNALKSGRMQFLEDSVIEASPEEFSRDLETQATRDPQRFAKLALKVPLETDPRFWAALLYPLRFSRSPDPQAVDWQPATAEQCHAVLTRVRFDVHFETGRAWCRCVEERQDIKWPPEIIHLVARYATDHPDPQAYGNLVGEGTDERLDIEAVNCVRGVAAHALRRLLLDDAALYPTLKPTLAKIVKDRVLSVRAAAIGAILPKCTEVRLPESIHC